MRNIRSLSRAAEIARCRDLATSLGLEKAIEWHTTFQPIDVCLRTLSECDLLVLPYDHSENRRVLLSVAL